jgi:hypothetical protein
MTANDIKNLIIKVSKRAKKNASYRPTKAQKASLTLLTDGTYDSVSFVRQGNFTLAVVTSTTAAVPTLYGMAKRNVSVDPENLDMGRCVALSAAVRSAAGIQE